MKEGGKKRSESEREKTKIRERQRRAITSNILHGLREHGGYRLSPRADINEVLRQLANEAGWVVEPNGTTYRSKVLNKCPLCGADKTIISTTTTTSSCETTSLPDVGGSVSIGDPVNNEATVVPVVCDPMYTWQEQVAVEDSLSNANANAVGMGMTHLEESGNMNMNLSNYNHTKVLGPMPEEPSASMPLLTSDCHLWNHAVKSNDVPFLHLQQF